jgi:hypothetical protein
MSAPYTVVPASPRRRGARICKGPIVVAVVLRHGWPPAKRTAFANLLAGFLNGFAAAGRDPANPDRKEAANG